MTKSALLLLAVACGFVIWIIVLALIFSHHAKAAEGDLWVDFTVGTNHSRGYWVDDSTGTNIEKDFEENNPGIGLTYGINDYIDIGAGNVFKNSYDNNSVYVAANFKYPFPMPGTPMRLEPGIMAIFATGYNDTPEDKYTIGGDILPIPLPNMTLVIDDKFHARVGWMPDIDGDSDDGTDDRVGFWLLQFGVRFGGI